MASSTSSFTKSAICSLVIALFVSLFALYLTVSLWRKVRQQASATVAKTTYFSALVVFVTLFLAMLSIFVLMAVQLSTQRIYSHLDQSTLFAVSRSLFFIFYKSWFLSSYFFLLTRLIITFRDSAFAISNRIMYTHLVLMALITISFCFIFAFMMRGQGGVLPQIAIAVEISLFAIGEGHVGYVFNRRLFRLVVMQRQTVFNNERPSLSDTQDRILTVIRKNTLLASVQMAAMLTMVTIYTVGAVSSDGDYWLFDTYPQSQLHFVVFDAVQAALVCVQSLCIYLGFKVNDTEYLTLCKRCDAKCEVFFEQMTHRKLNDNAGVQHGGTMVESARSMSHSNSGSPANTSKNDENDHNCP